MTKGKHEKDKAAAIKQVKQSLSTNIILGTMLLASILLIISLAFGSWG